MVNPPEGYRVLAPDEIIREGDLMCMSDFRSPTPVATTIGKKYGEVSPGFRVIRKIEADEPTVSADAPADHELRGTW